MQAWIGSLVALALAQPSEDPRAIAPAANRPEIIAPGGDPSRAKPPKTRPPKGEPPPKVEPPPKDEPTPPPTVEPKPTPPPTTSGTDPTDTDSDRCFPARGRCRRLNVVGIALASVGVGMVGAGIGFMLAPPWPGDTGPNEPIFDRSLRSPGVVLVALGGASLVTGVILIAAGHASHKKETSRRTAARVQVGPGGLRW